MSKLRISPDLQLPREAVTSTFVIYGGKGMGKTNFGSVFAEELSHARLRFAVIDPMGVWWGLRHSADGKSPGIELLILGGVKGDMPIDPTAGAVVADLVADETVNVLIDISRHANGKMWTIGERIRFVRDYFMQLYGRQGEQRRPLMQVVDEAARFCPQLIRKNEDDAAACLSAVAVMVEEGRNVGVGVCLLTQRSARLNKDVAELADCMIAFRIVGPRSIEAVLDWFGEHIDKSRWKDLIEKLRKLPIGRALVVSPGWLEFEGEAQIRPRETFDSSATPKPGEKAKTPHGAAAKPDLGKYQERMSATIERAKAEDPRALRAQLSEVRNQLSVAEKKLANAPVEKSNTEIKRVEVPVLAASEIARLEKLCARVEHVSEPLEALRLDLQTLLRRTYSLIGVKQAEMLRPDKTLTGAPRSQISELRPLGNAPRKIESTDRSTPGPKAGADFSAGELRISVKQQQILDALSRVKFANTEPRPVSTSLAVANRVGAAEGPARDGNKPLMRNRAAGVPSPTGSTASDTLSPSGGLRRILVSLAQRPQGLTPRQIGVRAGLSSKGGTFSTYLSRARTNDWIEGDKSGIRITQGGLDSLGSFEPLPTGQALLEHWLGQMGESGAARILRVLAEAYPNALTKAEVGERAVISAAGGTFSTYLSRLRSLELISGNAELKASNEFFE